MSMPSDIHFGFGKSQSIGGTFVHFPFKEYKQWALTSGTAENERVLSDIKSSLSNAQIETDNTQRESAQPSTGSTFVLRVAAITEDLCKSIKMPECYSSAALMHDVLMRYEEDVLGAVSQVAKQPSTAVDEVYAALDTTLAAHKCAQESSAVSGASTPGRLYELVLEERLSVLRASEDLKVKYPVAKAAHEFRRRIDRLDAVRKALDSNHPEDKPCTVINGSWCSFKDDPETPYSVELKKARKAYKLATSEMNVARQRLEDACGEDELLLTSISNMLTEELSSGLLFFRSVLPNYVRKVGTRSSTSGHSVEQQSKDKSERRVKFAGLSEGDSEGENNASDDDEKADEDGQSPEDKSTS